MSPGVWSAFVDELTKIAAMRAAVSEMRSSVARLPGEKRATMVKYTGPTKVAASTLSKRTNRLFGLPLDPPKRNVRRYENGPSAAASADRSQYPIAGQATPNISSSHTMNPATGPGGV